LSAGADQVVNDVTDSEPVFSGEERALLRRQLGPDAADRARVRSALLSSVGAGALTPAAQRADALMHTHALGATAAKAGAGGVVHTFTAKLVVLGLVVASGTTAVVLRGPSEQTRPGLQAPVAVRVTERAGSAQPTVPALPGELAAPADLEPVLQPLAANDVAVGEARTTVPLVAAAKHSRVSSGQLHGSGRGEVSSPLAAEVESVTSTSTSMSANVTDALQVTQAPAPPPALETQPLAAASAPAAVATQTPEQPIQPKHQLERELTLVRAASDALQHADAGAALLKLQQYQTEFPRGALRLEVEALRAIALCTSHAATAAAMSAVFLKAHAGSPLAARVRRACDER
jgi:hypothetical protein